jgi:hypothetical protein
MQRIIVVAGVIAALTYLFTDSQPCQSQPPKGDQAYTVRIVRVGETYQAIRFKNKTGESWIADGLKWVKLMDAAPPPAGDYDVLLVATDRDFSAMRYDRVSGTSWLLRGGSKWAKMEEPE